MEDLQGVREHLTQMTKIRGPEEIHGAVVIEFTKTLSISSTCSGAKDKKDAATGEMPIPGIMLVMNMSVRQPVHHQIGTERTWSSRTTS